MSQAEIKIALEDHLPEKALDQIAQLILIHKVNLTITRSRVSKLGDFRAPTNKRPPRLSINGDLNKYAFLLTLLHEIAHLLVWNTHRLKYRRIKPHGLEWKEEFQKLMNPFLNEEIFPNDLLSIMIKHIQNPKASSSSDIALQRALKKYDEGENLPILADLEIGDSFNFRGKRFEILKKNRSRYLCIEYISRKKFLIHSMIEIDML